MPPWQSSVSRVQFVMIQMRSWVGAGLSVFCIGCFVGAVAAGPLRPATPGTASATLADTLPGVLATCTDFRSLQSFGVHAQRLGSDGSVATGWTAQGARLCLGSTQNVATSMLSDGAGGAFVVWVDERSGDADLYLQRLSSSGEVGTGWPQEGIPLCVAQGGQVQVSMCSDAAGGAIMAWQDYRGGESGDIYAQRVTALGELLWTSDGAVVSGDSTDDASPALVADGAGGAVLVWEDNRSGYPRLYVRTISPTGSVSSATALFSASLGTQRNPTFTSGLGPGGVLIWDERRVDGLSLRATKLDAQGNLVGGWPDGGAGLSVGPLDELSHAAVSDSAGGAIVVWSASGDSSANIRAQHLRFDGVAMWPEGGAVICDERREQYAPAVASDWAGGAILAWEDHRNGRSDIYAQRVLTDGSAAWDSNGVSVCLMPGDQYGVALAPDGAGGVFATWSDATRAGRASFLRSQPAFSGQVPVLESFELGPGRAKLSFKTGEGDNRRMVLERRLQNADWVSVRTVLADNEGRFVIEDRGVSPGAHVTYRLSLPMAGGSVVHFDEIMLDIPEAVSLTLRYATNVDGGRALKVALALATNEIARIEMLDIQGRRVLSQDLGDLGAGSHEVRVPIANRSPGLYFVRLHQGRESRSARVVVVR